MASKDTQRRLISDNKKRPRDPNVVDVRRTVSSRSPSADLKCPMQIIIFLGQDDRFYLSTKSCLHHRYHPALKAEAILRGRTDMEQGDLDLLSLLFIIRHAATTSPVESMNRNIKDTMGCSSNTNTSKSLLKMAKGSNRTK